MNVTWTENTEKTILTATWDPIPGAEGYAFFKDGQRISVGTKPGQTSTHFGLDGKSHRFGISPLMRGQGAETQYPLPVTPPPPPPPSTSRMRVGVIANVAGYGAPAQKNVKDLARTLIREDRGDFAIVWAAAQSPKIDVIAIINKSASSPGIGAKILEFDNEPYNGAWDIAAWSKQAESVLKTIKLAHPDKITLLPVGPPWNNGDIQVGGVWVDCVKAINQAAPGVWEWVDGIAIHPYSQPYGPEIRYSVVDKWRSNLQAIPKAKDKPFWITEIGWPTGGNTWPPAQTEQQQHDYLIKAINDYGKRGDVAALLVYKDRDHQPAGATSDSEAYFGVLDSTLTRKKSAWQVLHDAPQ